MGAGNDRRTVELATLLEQIAIDRNDRAVADRYAEFRRRFQRAAGIPPGEAPAASSDPGAATPQEFAVPTIEAELDEPAAEIPARDRPQPPWAFPCLSNPWCTKLIYRTSGRRSPSNSRKRWSRLRATCRTLRRRARRDSRRVLLSNLELQPVPPAEVCHENELQPVISADAASGGPRGGFRIGSHRPWEFLLSSRTCRKGRSEPQSAPGPAPAPVTHAFRQRHSREARARRSGSEWTSGRSVRRISLRHGRSRQGR